MFNVIIEMVLELTSLLLTLNLKNVSYFELLAVSKTVNILPFIVLNP